VNAGIPFDHLLLIGAGIVGRAIADAHLDAAIPFDLIDNNPQNLAVAGELLARPGWKVTPHAAPPFGGSCLRFTQDPVREGTKTLIIESIAERLDAKRNLLADIAAAIGTEFCFASNTSSLRIAEIAAAIRDPERVCGMHFFMPVRGRELVEVVGAPGTASRVLEAVSLHAQRLGKRPLRVHDTPGFVVNRILWPYLNQSLALLGAGADHRQISVAAKRCGMPMSPLVLIDMIGLRTAFDAGRAAWQAFPKRIEPSPILPGMIKAGLQGRSGGAGFYSYSPDPMACKEDELTAASRQVIGKYLRNERTWSDDEVYLNLAVPMWIEALLVCQEKLIPDRQTVTDALAGGLGCNPPGGFWEQFDRLGIERLRKSIELFAPSFKAMNIPASLAQSLAHSRTLHDAVQHWLMTTPHPHRA